MKAAKMLSPANLAELTAALPRMTEKSKVVAGGTDLVVAIKEGRARPDLLLNVLDVKEMRAVLKKADALEIGAAVPFGEIASAEAVRRYFPALPTPRRTSAQNRYATAARSAATSAAPPRREICSRAAAPTARACASPTPSGRDPQNVPLRLDDTKKAGCSARRRPGHRLRFAAAAARRQCQRLRQTGLAHGGHDRQAQHRHVGEFDADGRIASPAVTLGALAKAPIFAREAITAIEGNYPDEAASARLAAALAREVDKAIPGRASQPYKRHAVRGAAADVI